VNIFIHKWWILWKRRKNLILFRDEITTNFFT
jgi:hypothetical protein